MLKLINTLATRNFDAMPISEKKNFRNFSLDEIKELFATLGEKSFRAQQTWDWLWKKGARSFDEMTNLSAALREKLKEQFDIPSLQVDATQKSSDGTIKVRFKTYDNFFVEGVLQLKGVLQF